MVGLLVSADKAARGIPAKHPPEGEDVRSEPGKWREAGRGDLVNL